MTTGGKDLFISHSSGDGGAARELKTLLESAGYSVWMAPDDIVGSKPWAEQIVDAIETSRLMLVLISSSANESPYVSREVNLAFSHKRAVLPIRIEPVAPEASLELFLSLVQRVDAFPAPLTNHADRILKRLALTLDDPRTPSQVLARAIPAPVPTNDGPPTPIETPPILTSRTSPPSAAPAPPTLPGPGSRVGAFTIEAVLGEGGMATVYRARQDEPSRLVALKVIRADHASDPAYRQRFLAEKDTLATLEHPSIVPIFAAGDANGVLYIAMRLVDGTDLAGKLAASGPMSVADTIATLAPVADAIDYAHEMGVVHRDLKPSNIVMDKRGRPYLMDFGLGKHLDRSQGLSAPGIAVGTLEYMAPEQFSGLVDPPLAGRIDVYALACVAYACLTGASPYRAETPERVMFAHLHEQPESIRAARPDLAAAIDAVVRRALSKNPAERYESAKALVDALAAASAVSEQTTVAFVRPRLYGRAARLGVWARANTALAGALIAGLAVLVIGTGLVGLNLTGATSTASPRPGTSGIAVGSPGQSTGASSPPTAGATAGPTSGPSVGPTPSPGPGTTGTAAPTLGPTATPRLPTPTAGPVADTSPPTSGAIAINNGASYTTKGSVVVTLKTKPGDPQSGISRYVWSTSNARPSSGSHAYTGGSFGASVGTGSRGTRHLYVWFQNGDGVWSTTPASDAITFDNAPTRNSICQTISSPASGYYATYNVWISTTCFSDPDGDALVYTATQPASGTLTGKVPSACGGANRECWTYTPPSSWTGTPYEVTFTISVKDDLGAGSPGTTYHLCLNESSCP